MINRAALIAVVALLLVTVLSPWLSWYAPIVFAWFLPLHILLVASFGLFTLLFYGTPLIGSWLFDRAERAHVTVDPVLELNLPGGDPTRVVLLIHGTFARKNEWTQPASPLATALSEATTVATFRWSGANSMRCRAAAAQGLRRSIEELTRRGYDHIGIVAHSHAGNIALKACEDPLTASRVQAIVCIATPFITAWRPRLRVVASWHARVGLALMAAGMGAGFMLLTQVLAGSLVEAQSTRVVIAGAASMLLTVVAGIAGLTLALRIRLDDPRQPLDPDIADSVFDADGVAPLRDRTLIVTRGGDEADGMLKLASLVNRQIVALANKDFDGRLKEGLLDVQASGFGGLSRGMVYGGLALSGAVPSLAFGVNALRSQTGVFLTSAETPPGEWTHRHFPGTGTGDGEGLYHSSLYGDGDVIAAIRRWLSDRGVMGLGASGRQSPP